MATQCVFCGHNDLLPVHTQYLYRQDDKFLLVKDVPCLQCTFCGEQYFAGPILKTIEQKFYAIHVQGYQASHEIQIPVESFRALQQAEPALASEAH